jgi:hypothetical protein
MTLNVHIPKLPVADLIYKLLISFWFIKLFRVSNICFKFIYFEIQIFKISNISDGDTSCTKVAVLNKM